ncbi:MAG: hypothetical protein KatS3mg124_0854 [Porticoccaceae bacterium]|nr:MAG: hypothetical protein KatS3mg124_0854 [Porticoccaceae bacterium]
MNTPSVVDGRPGHCLSIGDRGLAYGHGVFETMRLAEGRLPLWPLHRARMREGLARLGIPCPDEAVECSLRALLERCPPAGVVKLTVTAGEGSRGYAPGVVAPRVFAQYFPAPGRPEPLRLAVSPHRLPHHPPLAGIKHLNRLDQVLAAAAVPPGRVALQLDVAGRVVETAGHNLFLRCHRRWWTPPVDRCGVAGVMRRLLLERLLPERGESAEERGLTLDDLAKAEEVFACNAVIGVVPVAEVGGGGELCSGTPHGSSPRLVGGGVSVFSRLIPVLVVVASCLAGTLASARFWLESGLASPLRVPEAGLELEVRRGEGLGALARRLHSEGVLADPWPLVVHARLARLDRIQAGHYHLPAGGRVADLVAMVVRGEVVRHRITFPEGLTVREWLARLNAASYLADLPLTLEALEQALPPPQGESVEGWFFPDTYLYSRGESALALMGAARRRMVAVLDEEWRRRAPDLPLADRYQALILASIVEKETGVAAERPRIAGVFLRRLARGMRLQTDPTVIYGLGEAFDGNLTRAHLRADHPYNTYRVAGLPPTPIANPGRAAIHAVLHPAAGDELYFVARGDGSHAFARTLEEHRRLVRRYQIDERPADYRSAPPPEAAR